MKVLATGDLHYSLPQFDWLLERAANYDVVIIAGDLLDIAGHVDLDAQILVVQRYLEELSKNSTLLFCSGNHDGDRKTSHDEYVCDWMASDLMPNQFGDYMSYTAEGWRFTMCPWWDGPVTEKEVAAFLEKQAAIERESWFVVHHSPPAESKTSWTGKRDIGDQQLLKFIREHQPEIVLSGHVHNAPFKSDGGWIDQIGKTRVFNPGRQMGFMPAILKFDLAEKRVVWESLAGVEEADL